MLRFSDDAYIYLIEDSVTNQFSEPIVVVNEDLLKRNLRNLPENSTYKTNPDDFFIHLVGRFSYLYLDGNEFFDSDHRKVYKFSDFIKEETEVSGK